MTPEQIAALPEEWRAVAEAIETNAVRLGGFPPDAVECLLAQLAVERETVAILSASRHAWACLHDGRTDPFEPLADEWDWGCDDCAPEGKADCWANHARTLARQQLGLPEEDPAPQAP